MSSFSWIASMKPFPAGPSSAVLRCSSTCWDRQAAAFSSQNALLILASGLSRYNAPRRVPSRPCSACALADDCSRACYSATSDCESVARNQSATGLGATRSPSCSTTHSASSSPRLCGSGHLCR